MGLRISSLAGNRPRGYIPRSTWKMKAGIHPEYYETDIDTAGRVEKFARRYGSTKAARAEKKA